jgi:hypothetical protein
VLSLASCIQAPDLPEYELFAAILLDPNQLENCMYYSAVKKRVGDEHQWFLFKPDEHIKLSKSQIFSEFLCQMVFYRQIIKGSPKLPENTDTQPFDSQITEGIEKDALITCLETMESNMKIHVASPDTDSSSGASHGELSREANIYDSTVGQLLQGT